MANARLVIVSGATGDLGKAYLSYFKSHPDCVCYGISRREEENPLENVHYLVSDLENEQTTRNQIDYISFHDVVKATYIHPVGRFKFEETGSPQIDSDDDTIDDEVFRSNISTFHNVVRPLMANRPQYQRIPLTLVAFGSLSDNFNVPWWGSYSKSKLILRKDIRELTRLEQYVHSIFVNLSSVRTANEFKTRPHADATYWISPEEIVNRTKGIIESPTQRYLELDVFNDSPEYHAGYYSDHEALKAKWRRDMFGE